MSKASRARRPKTEVKPTAFDASLTSRVAAEAAGTGPFCIICAEPIVYSAVNPCNNVTCHVCSFRQRALYKRDTCLVCRTDHPDVIYAGEPLEHARYDAYVPQAQAHHSAKYKAHFTLQLVMDSTLAYLKNTCPVCRAEFALYGQLAAHVRTHGQQYCDICASHGNKFVPELPLYTAAALQKHLGEGDLSGFLGHPRCKFCRHKRFYSDDELAVHVRDTHEKCHICTSDNNLADYYRNYDDLYLHFRHTHYVCTVPLCVEKRFVVFREDLDLTAHMLKEHGGIAGSNGRLVIGASSGFHSQLSTVAKPQGDPPAVKKRRMEERAKHYLHNDQTKLAEFQKSVQTFKARRITSTDLLKQWQTLFPPDADLPLLVLNLIETFLPNADQRMLLQNCLDKLSPETMGSTHQSFPLLAGAQASNYKSLTWGAGASLKRNQDELFPALAKPAKAPTVSNGPVRYTVIKKPLKEPKNQVNTYKENTLYVPTYLDAPKAVSASPRLSPSPSLSRNLSRSQSPALTYLAPLSTPTLPDLKFPALVKKTKKEIPAVRTVASSSTWGLGLVAAEAKPEEEWGIPIIDKRAEKLRRKARKN